MNFEYTDDQKAGFAAFERLCRERVAPHSAEMDRAGYDKALALLRGNLKTLAGFGYLGLRFPERYGGSHRPLVGLRAHALRPRAGGGPGLAGLPDVHGLGRRGGRGRLRVRADRVHAAGAAAARGRPAGERRGPAGARDRDARRRAGRRGTCSRCRRCPAPATCTSRRPRTRSSQVPRASTSASAAPSAS